MDDFCTTFLAFKGPNSQDIKAHL